MRLLLFGLDDRIKPEVLLYSLDLIYFIDHKFDLYRYTAVNVAFNQFLSTIKLRGVNSRFVAKGSRSAFQEIKFYHFSTYRIYLKYSDIWVLVNIRNVVQTPQAVSDQDLHFMPVFWQFLYISTCISRKHAF